MSQAFASPFANGVALGKADALFLSAGAWRVFLFLSSGPRSFDVQASSGEAAIKAGWLKLKAERDGKVRA